MNLGCSVCANPSSLGIQIISLSISVFPKLQLLQRGREVWLLASVQLCIHNFASTASCKNCPVVESQFVPWMDRPKSKHNCWIEQVRNHQKPLQAYNICRNSLHPSNKHLRNMGSRTSQSLRCWKCNLTCMTNKNDYEECDQRTFPTSNNGWQHLNSRMFLGERSTSFWRYPSSCRKKLRFVHHWVPLSFKQCQQKKTLSSSMPWVHMLVSESCPRAPWFLDDFKGSSHHCWDQVRLWCQDLWKYGTSPTSTHITHSCAGKGLFSIPLYRCRYP